MKRVPWIVDTGGMQHSHKTKAKADEEAEYLRFRGYSPQVYQYVSRSVFARASVSLAPGSRRG